MALARRCLWPLLVAAGAASLASGGCAAISGLSDLQRDDCAFGCDGGPDGESADGAGPDAAGDAAAETSDGGNGAADSTTGADSSISDAPPSDSQASDAPEDAPSVSDAEDAPTDAPVEGAAACGNFGQPCCAGACDSPLVCQADQTCGCGTLLQCNGSCVNEATDPANCGGCAHVCMAGANQTATCSSSMCGAACKAGYADCADAGTACATSTATDPSNCGACGHACPVAGQMCSSSVCGCPVGAQVCGGQCVNTTSDANNCGACGHSCLGGACAGSACQPVTLASGVNAPTGIALDPSFVYFTSPTDGTVSKVPVAGGAVVPIATGQIAPTGVAVDAVNVYWAQYGPTGLTGGVSKAALPNGSPVPLVTMVSAFYVATNGVNVYFTRGQFGTVESVPVGGGSATPIWTSNKFPYTIAVDGLNVYWGVFNNNLGVYKVPIATGSPVTLFANGYSNAQGVAADGTNVYFATFLASGAVYKTDPNGANVVSLATNLARPFGIAVDSSYVYVTTSSAVVRVPLSGGTPTQLAADPGPQQIAVDSKAIYWASGSGAILKLAK